MLLARAGHAVTILERAPQLGPVGAGFLLQPAGQEILAEWGLFARIAAASTRIERLEAYTAAGRRLTSLPYADAALGACAYGVQRGVLFSALHEAARTAGAAETLGVELASVEENPGSITVRDTTGRVHGPFDLLVGADGARSVIRQWLNPHTRSADYPHGALWGTGRSDWPADTLYQVTRNAQQLTGLMPIGGGQCGFFWGLRRAELAPLHARGFPAFRESVSRLCPQATAILDDLRGFDRLTFASYRHALPRRTASARCVLIGDAAHSMSPHLGQGANLALLDAAALSRQLAIQPLAAALPAYCSERRAHARYLALLSHALSPFFQSDSTLLGRGRDIALPLLCAWPWMRRQMCLTVAGMKTGFLDRL